MRTPISLAIAAMLAAGCAPRRRPEPAPSPGATPGGARGAGAGARPGTARAWSFRYRSGAAAYAVTSDATIELRADSGAHQQAVSSSTYLTYFLRDSLDGAVVSGTVDSLVVSAGGGATAQRPLSAPIPFHGTLDRAHGRARLAEAASNPDCSSPATALLATAQDALVALPPTVTAGMTWQDSTTSAGCRGEIPVRTTSVHAYTVIGTDGAGATLRVKRATTLALEGAGTSRGQQVSIAGRGSGASDLLFDLPNGRYLGASGDFTTELTLTVAGRAQTFIQRGRQQTVVTARD